MTELLSKELKFYVKLLTFQPFLIRKEVTEQISHQNVLLSPFDVIHVSVLVLSTRRLIQATKLEYSLMFLCRALQNLKH